MSLRIQLLGKPSVIRDGEPAPQPKGRKAWALLAYLVGARMSSSREQLAGLLFSDADDPLGALRWNLAELRRVLGSAEALKGDLIAFDPRNAVVDTEVVRSGSWADAVALSGLGRELLEGMDFATSPSFDAWLLNERRHLRAASEAILREAAQAQLTSGNQDGAIDNATRLVSLDPLNEEYQALLIRSYASAGDRQSAARQLAACIELFRKELGVEPGPSVAAASHVPSGTGTAAPVAGPAAARAQFDAGRAAITAGALEPGLECLRRAATEAHACGDLELKAEALFEMGAALAHSGRASLKEEGAVALHETIALSARTGRTSVAAAAHRELAWLEFLAARYDRAEAWLDTGTDLAGNDDAERARIRYILACTFSDVGSYPEAIDHFEGSAALLETTGDAKQLARSLAFVGRLYVLQGEFLKAREVLEHSLDLVRSEGWIGFQPFPEAFLGYVELAEGRVDVAANLLEHSFALGCQIADTCYEGLAERGLGFVAEARGRTDDAIEKLVDGYARLTQRLDYVWMQAYGLEGLCDLATRHGHPNAERWVSELEVLAGRAGMRELLARAYLHRARLGDDGSVEAAAVLASSVNNPLLREAVQAAAAATTS
jgi:DNA-binding SARP family transcriptional activator